MALKHASGSYLLKRSGEESKYEEDVVIGYEGGDDSDDHHCPLTEQKHRFTADVIGQRRETHRPEHDAHRENCLRQVFEIFALADQVPLKQYDILPG